MSNAALKHDCRRWLHLALSLGMILGTFMMLSGCGSVTAPESSAEGALVVFVGNKEARFRAYSVSVEVQLAWSSEPPRSYKIIVENVSVEKTSVSVVPSNVSVRTVVDSSTILEVTLENPVTESAVRIAPVSSEQAVRFAVVGDTQGRNGIFGTMLAAMGEEQISFLVHLGDMTPTGSEPEFDAFSDTISTLSVPFYPVPGNHDVKSKGLDSFRDRFGPERRFFDYDSYRFVFLDDSDGRMSEDRLLWLDEVLTGRLPAFVFMHVPPADPRGLDHALLDPAEAKSFIDLVTDPGKQVLAVFSGHVHMFDLSERDGVLFITSGGGGAGLYEVPEAGGYHHYVVVSASEREVRVTPRRTEIPVVAQDLVLTAKDIEVVLSPEELYMLPSISAEGSYQNQFGNYSESRRYKGILVRDLLHPIGGLRPNEELVVYAADGYSQVFAHRNVYPETDDWLEAQGEMVLALSADDTKPPQWGEGYRIVFLPGDGNYSNDDCAATSVAGQGWDVYESAGARWVKNVVRMEVRPCQTH